jgi:hypothetical protein
VDPPDEPLDALTNEWLKGFSELTAPRAGAVAAAVSESLPSTQGEAAEFIERRLKNLEI